MAAEPRLYPLVLATDLVPATHLHATPQRRALRALLPLLAEQDIALVATDALANAIDRGVAAAGRPAAVAGTPRQRGHSRPANAEGVIAWAGRLSLALRVQRGTALRWHRMPANGNIAPPVGVWATLGNAERQTPRGPASSPDPDGLTVAAPRP